MFDETEKISDKESTSQPADEAYLIDAPDIDPGGTEIDYADALRLLLGAVLESSDLFKSWFEAGRLRSSSLVRTDFEMGEIEYPLWYSAVGFGLRSADAARQNLKTAIGISGKLAGFFFTPAKVIVDSIPLRPLRNGFGSMVARGEVEVGQWAEITAKEAARSRVLARETVNYALDDIIRDLSKNPALEALIKSQIDQLAIDLPQTTQIDVLVRVLANNYITYLSENPDEVQGLIRTQGDTYLAHLEENPEQVQSLVQGQSAGMIEDITGEIREFTVTGDSFLELLARKLFRRAPRAALSELPPVNLPSTPGARLKGELVQQTKENND